LVKSNLVNRLHAEQVERLRHHLLGRFQQQDPRDFLFTPVHFGGLVELRNFGRDFVNQVANPVDLQIRDCELKLLRQPKDRQSEFLLLRVGYLESI
jgi:hypothetical protein